MLLSNCFLSTLNSNIFVSSEFLLVQLSYLFGGNIQLLAAIFYLRASTWHFIFKTKKILFFWNVSHLKRKWCLRPFETPNNNIFKYSTYDYKMVYGEIDREKINFILLNSSKYLPFGFHLKIHQLIFYWFCELDIEINIIRLITSGYLLRRMLFIHFASVNAKKIIPILIVGICLFHRIISKHTKQVTTWNRLDRLSTIIQDYHWMITFSILLRDIHIFHTSNVSQWQCSIIYLAHFYLDYNYKICTRFIEICKTN